MAKVDYKAALKAAEQFTDDDTPWKDKFTAIISNNPKAQGDAFKLRFALQLDKQGADTKELVKRIDSISEMFEEKSKPPSGNGKSVKYGGVEFGDILKEFVPDSKLSFVERKKAFKDFDLDNNGYVDVIEFLMFLYKEQILEGYKHRHGLSSVQAENPDQTEAEALMQEFVNVAVLIDLKLDDQILSLAKLKKEFEVDMQKIKDEATSEVKKRQLSNNLKARESKYEEDQKQFYSADQIGKSRRKLLKTQEKHLRELEASIDQEAAEALKPKKNLKMP